MSLTTLNPMPFFHWPTGRFTHKGKTFLASGYLTMNSDMKACNIGLLTVPTLQGVKLPYGTILVLLRFLLSEQAQLREINSKLQKQ